MTSTPPLVPPDKQPFIQRLDTLMIGIALLLGCVLAALSAATYLGYNAGMLDLGNMSQAIWSVTQGQPLVFTSEDGPTSRLAVHVEFIYYLFALPYALWPSPLLLLIAQAVLFVLGALPVYRLALRNTDSRFAARCLTLIYLFYPVAQTAVLFDFHGDTLGMPLLLFALDALDRQRWPMFGLWLVLALLCKFYVAVPVVLLGPLIGWLYGRWRVGLLTSAGGVLYGILTFFIVRPFFTTASTAETQRGLNYVTFYFSQLPEVLPTLGDRFFNAIIVFGPVLLIGWRGWRWLLPGLPIAAAVLISTGPGASYGYKHHHYALLVPFIVMAAIDGTRRMQQAAQLAAAQEKPPRRRGRSWRGDLGLTLAIVLLFNALLVDTPLNPFFWLAPPAQGLDPSRYGITARDAVKDAFLAQQVPPAAPLAASVYLAPHLAQRSILHLVRYPDDPGGERLPALLPNVDYVLPDALFDVRFVVNGEVLAGAAYERAEIGYLLNDASFGLVAARDGLLLFARDAAPERVLQQRIEAVPTVAAPALLAAFGDEIGLVRAAVEPLGGRRYRASFAWRAAGPAAPQGDYVAVSRLEGIAGARIVHLPTYAVLPTNQWQPREVIQETFDIVLPDDIVPGTYRWRVGWYDLAHSEAYATDERSLLPGSQEVEVFSLEVPAAP